MVTIQQISPFGQERDYEYMQEALLEARKAYKQGEVPIGAVVVSPDGSILGRGYNRVETEKTQAAHAEILAIRAASQSLGDWRLSGCWVYITLEPCTMCAALIVLSRCLGIVYGATSPIFGYRLDNELNSRVYKEDTLLQVGGILSQESADILRSFFQKKREQNERDKEKTRGGSDGEC